MEDIVVLQDLKKIFNRNTIDEKAAINGIRLKVKREEFVTVIGSNGAGKTTLLNLIAGTFLPDEGDASARTSKGKIPWKDFPKPIDGDGLLDDD
jgi:putative ABC transport system ATP-binding protein